MAGFLGRFLFFLFWAELLVLGLFILRVGFLSAFLLCVLSALAGGYLVRQGGLATLFGGMMGKDGRGAQPMVEGIFVLLAGLLLIFPGFISDALALALLLPAARRFVSSFFPQNTSYDSPQRPPAQGDIIEGDFVVIEEDAPQIQRPQDKGPP